MLVCVSSIIKTENWCHWQRQIRGGFKVYFDRSICVQDTLAANNFNRAYAEIQKSRIFSRAEMFSCQLLDMGISCYTSPRTEIIQSYSLFNQKWHTIFKWDWVRNGTSELARICTCGRLQIFASWQDGLRVVSCQCWHCWVKELSTIICHSSW